MAVPRHFLWIMNLTPASADARPHAPVDSGAVLFLKLAPGSGQSMEPGHSATPRARGSQQEPPRAPATHLPGQRLDRGAAGQPNSPLTPHTPSLLAKERSLACRCTCVQVSPILQPLRSPGPRSTRPGSGRHTSTWIDARWFPESVRSHPGALPGDGHPKREPLVSHVQIHGEFIHVADGTS